MKNCKDTVLTSNIENLRCKILSEEVRLKSYIGNDYIIWHSRKEKTIGTETVSGTDYVFSMFCFIHPIAYQSIYDKTTQWLREMAYLIISLPYKLENLRLGSPWS